MGRDEAAKAIENRIRRHAASSGYTLQRNPVRTQTAPGFGLYRLAKGGSVPSRYSMTLPEVERALAVGTMHPNSWTPHHARTTRWLTPRPIVEALGRFDLDPAGAPDHELAARTYIPERGEDGLLLPWEGRVWMNPPYGPDSERFMRRMAEHGHGTALIFARTDTTMFFDSVWGAATAILFLRGRVSFLRPDGSPGSPAGASSCLVAFGDVDARALGTSGIEGRFLTLRSSLG